MTLALPPISLGDVIEANIITAGSQPSLQFSTAPGANPIQSATFNEFLQELGTPQSPVTQPVIGAIVVNNTNTQLSIVGPLGTQWLPPSTADYVAMASNTASQFSIQLPADLTINNTTGTLYVTYVYVQDEQVNQGAYPQVSSGNPGPAYLASPVTGLVNGVEQSNGFTFPLTVATNSVAFIAAGLLTVLSFINNSTAIINVDVEVNEILVMAFDLPSNAVAFPPIVLPQIPVVNVTITCPGLTGTQSVEVTAWMV